MTAELSVGITAWLRVPVSFFLTILLLASSGEATAAISTAGRLGVTITSPVTLSSLSTATARLALAGTANDRLGVARVTWQNDRGGQGVANGTRNWAVPNIQLAPGVNRILVTAYNRKGYRRQDSLVVTYKAPATPAPSPAANRPPVISGSPTTSVVAGTAYAFTPTASDPDGQTLTFSVMGAPAWASFNSTTGRLGGTPGAGNVALTEGIVITVSDGKASASLPAFSLAVVQTATGSATVSWLPPTRRTDGSSLTNLAGYHIRFGTSATALNQVITLNGSGLTRYMVEGLTTGKWYFGLSAFDSKGVESDTSNVGSKTIL